MIQRDIFSQMLAWKQQLSFKPLILRGARQTGKTYLARKLGERFSNMIEINCEGAHDIENIFSKDFSIERIIRELRLVTKQEIIPGKTLLFFDEIQEIPTAIQALRYFYEQQPNLHVLATGSLLDFTLENIGVSVGRVNFLYLYPISFMEFLATTDNQILVDEVLNHHGIEPLPEVAHNKLLEHLANYLAIGGMPEVVQRWIETKDFIECNAIQHNLVENFRQDFHKYAKKFQLKYVEMLFNSIPLQLGHKFKYSHVGQEYRKRELSPCLELLVKAQLAHPITHSAGNGMPLGAEIDLNKFKVIFLDVALAQTILGFNASQWLLDPAHTLVNQGAIVEAFVGQELLAYSNPAIKPNLYYWQRESRGSSAEVDYLIEQKQKIIPVEVKSGGYGRIKSLKLFLQSKQNSPHGMRFSLQNYSQYENIWNYPLYAIKAAMREKVF